MTVLEPAHRAMLAETFLFQGAQPQAAEQALVDPRCSLRQFRRGEVLYGPHQFERCLGILLEGTIQVSKGELIISCLGRGELFGAAALFNDRPDYATTLTAQADCTVLLLPQLLIEELMAAFPLVARNYVAYLSGRIRFLSEKIDDYTAGSAERKLAQYLLHAGAEGAGLTCSATGLARRLNVSRASLYRAFDALSAAGAVQRTGKSLRVLDAEALKRV